MEITVNKDALMEALLDNRAEHVDTFQKAPKVTVY